MSQQGQVFAQRSAGADGAPLWGYRYRLGGRDATRVQKGGYRSEQDAREALERALERVRRSNGIGRSPTLAELVGEYQPSTPSLPWRLRAAAAVSGSRFNVVFCWNPR